MTRPGRRGNFSLEHFRTKVGRRIVGLFFLCALLPTTALAVVAYARVRSELLTQSAERLHQSATDATMGIVERVQAIESELSLIARAIESAPEAGGEPTVREADLRRLDALSVASESGVQPLVGVLREPPVLTPTASRNLLDLGQTALVTSPSPRATRMEIFVAQSLEGAGDPPPTLWGRVIGDSLWSTAEVYATNIASVEVDYQEDKGYCLLDAALRPLDCSGSLLGWLTDGIPEGVSITPDVLRGDLSWTALGKRYRGHFRQVYLRGQFDTENWVIVVGESEGKVLGTLVAFRRNLIGILVLTLAFVGLLSAVQIRQSLEPLAELKAGTSRIAAQDFAARVHISSGDEFEELAGSFNDMARQVGQLVEDLEGLSLGTITALARTIDAKSQWTGGHSERVAAVSVSIARVMGLPESDLEKLRRGGLLHDIGKIGVPQSVLDKTESLEGEEWRAMRSHVTIGARILEPLKPLADVIPLVLHHHERFDGRGYPHGLAGEDIPPLVRILTVADTFDALQSDRPYRKARTPEESRRVIVGEVGVQFDPVVVQAFLQVLEQEAADPSPLDSLAPHVAPGGHFEKAGA